jgi:predicted nucleic acid-binding protein
MIRVVIDTNILVSALLQPIGARMDHTSQFTVVREN